MILTTTNQNVILQSGSQSIDVTNVPVRKLDTKLTPIKPVLENEPKSCKSELLTRLAQDQEDLEQAYARMGFNEPIEQ